MDAAIQGALAPFESALRVIARLGAAQDARAWVVGGTIRDALLGRAIRDVDLAIAGRALDLARAAAAELGASFVLLDEQYDTARIVLAGGAVIDLTALRAATLEEDLPARDFCANAIAAPLLASGGAGPLIDPLGGQADVAAGRLRLCGPGALAADPLRMLRAARLGATLGWRLDPALDQAIRQAAPLIGQVAAERICAELLSLLDQRWSAPWLRYLDRAGVLGRIIPELGPAHGHTQPSVHFLDVWDHTLEAVCCGEWLLAQLAGDQRPPVAAPPADAADPHPPAFFSRPAALAAQRDLTAALEWGARVLAHFASAPGGHGRAALWKLALLLHDVEKPSTRAEKPGGGISFYDHQTVGALTAASVGARLRLSNSEIAYLGAVVGGHMRPGQLNSEGETSPRAAYRFFRDLGDAAPDTLLHSLADHLATRGPHVSPHHWAMHLAWTDAMLGFHWDQRQVERRAPLVDGRALMAALGIGPGPQVGELLEAIREAQAAGEVATADEALALARRLYS